MFFLPDLNHFFDLLKDFFINYNDEIISTLFITAMIFIPVLLFRRHKKRSKDYYDDLINMYNDSDLHPKEIYKDFLRKNELSPRDSGYNFGPTSEGYELVIFVYNKQYNLEKKKGEKEKWKKKEEVHQNTTANNSISLEKTEEILA